MKTLSTSKAPAALGPYSQGLSTGNMTFVSGQLPVNPENGDIPETIEEQTAQSLSNIRNILAESKMTMANVIKTTVFLSDLDDFTRMNEIYGTFFEDPYPTRCCVQVAAIPKGCKVEIECIAIK